LSQEPLTIRVTHRFRASPERVFDAWLAPESAGKWLFATPTGRMVRVEVDPRVGGRFAFVDRRGGEEVEHLGEYLALERPHCLVFRFAVPKFSPERTRVCLEIVPGDGGCMLTLTHEGVLSAYASRTAEGWTTILDGLEAALSDGNPSSAR